MECHHGREENVGWIRMSETLATSSDLQTRMIRRILRQKDLVCSLLKGVQQFVHRLHCPGRSSNTIVFSNFSRDVQSDDVI